MTSGKLKTILAAVALTLIAAPAFADAIDGDWCYLSDGRRFSIRGPDIVTPGGAHLQGDYSRHAYSYPAPANERGGGKTIFMTLLDENTVHLRYGEAFAGDPETWIRCSPSTSALRFPKRS
jgi:hypothetical protein